MNLLLKANLILVLLLCLFDLKGQTDFRRGFIITNNNDTLHGLVDYRGEARNAKRCDFKESETSAVKEFNPFEIRGYRFTDGKFYISKKIKLKDGEINVFLEFLVNGIADLYYYADGTNIHYFIEKKDGQIIELTNEEEQVYVDGRAYLHETKSYIGSLTYAFADCPQIFKSINQAAFNDKSLIDITKKYHDYVCDSARCIIYEKQLPPLKFTFGAFVSMNASSLKLTKGSMYEAIDFETDYYPTLGLQMNMTLPRVNEKLSLQLSAEYGKFYFHGTSVGLASYLTESAYLHSSEIKGKMGIKYTYPKGKFRPTFMIGGNIISLFNKEEKRVEDFAGNSLDYQEDILADTLLGYNFDFGIDYHCSSAIIPYFNLGYSYSGGENDFNSIDDNKTPVTSNISTIYLQAGIYF
jgi:hypothetical protein